MSRTKPSRRDLLQLSGVVAVGYGVSVLLRKNAPLGRDVSTNPTAQALLRAVGTPGEGPRDADVVIVVFTDYQCPACRKAAPELQAAVREDGGVRIIYKDLPIFGDVSERAARVALAADRQGIYVKVHHTLMREWRALEPPVLRAAVEGAGGNWARIERDLDADGRAMDFALLQNRLDARSLGVAGTPGFLIGTTLVVGALSRSEFRKVIAAARHG